MEYCCLLIRVLIFLEEKEINEHKSSEHRRLGFHVQIQRKRDAEVVRVREGLLRKAAPLLRDRSHLLAIQAQHLKLYITAAFERAKWPFDFEKWCCAIWSINCEVGNAKGPVLLDHANYGARGSRHFQLL